MPRKTPPFVDKNAVKGHVYYSFRRGKGPRIRLPGVPGTDEFNEAYAACLAGEMSKPKARREAIKPGSIAALVASYLRSPEYADLRETTKVGYASRIEALRTKHGHRSVAGLNRARIITGILQPYADRPGARLAILKMLRVLIRHAIAIGWLKHDPSLGIKRPKSGEIRSWSDEEIAQFEAHWPVGTKQRLAFALHLNTGQRRSDVHRMTWADVTEDSVRVVQQKTGAKLTIRLHRDLAAILAQTPREHVTLINTAFGKPFTVDGYSQWLRDAIKAAGLPLDCQPHGLRKAAGRRLAEAGCTAKEIMAVLGHKTLAEAERYTREADQAQLASGAVIKLEGRTENRVSQTAPESLGKAAKTSKDTM
jgi:integrase